VLVDSNVLLDVMTGDGAWVEWSERALREWGERSPLVINPLVYAEVSVAIPTIEELDDLLPPRLYRRDELPYAAGFLAGKVFERYRRSGGARRSSLPDFYIGAHAAVAGYELMTRDASRYRSYFPTVVLIAPE
jgi:predicted nucleic acid-binding protein